MAAKKPGLIVDVLASGAPDEEAPPPEADTAESIPPTRGSDAEGLISDIQAQLDRLRSLMADL